MEQEYDFDLLSPVEQQKIVELIAKDNLEHANKLKKEVHPRKTFYTIFLKRVIDIVLSFIAFFITIPINVLIAIITFFDVGRPILFGQKRMGKGCNPFTLYKFRNMTNETDEKGILLPADQRTTKWGQFVRSTSLDELLNFWSILKGDMSLIGPRPLPMVYKGRFCSYHESRHNVKPGLDCPLHDSTMTYMTWQNRLDNDAWYVENVSFLTDCKLVILLFRETFFGKEKKDRARGGSEGTFMGYDAEGNVMNSKQIPRSYFERVLNEGKNNE